MKYTRSIEKMVEIEVIYPDIHLNGILWAGEPMHAQKQNDPYFLYFFSNVLLTTMNINYLIFFPLFPSFYSFFDIWQSRHYPITLTSSFADLSIKGDMIDWCFNYDIHGHSPDPSFFHREVSLLLAETKLANKNVLNKIYISHIKGIKSM